jgi:integrase
MAEPRFDGTTGRWYIRIRTPAGGRIKRLIPKHPGWKKLDRRPRTVPPEVLAYARPFQDADARARVGLPVELPIADPLGETLKRFLTSYRSVRRPRSAKELARAIEVFSAYCRGRRVETLQAVTPEVCRSFLEDAAAGGKGHATLTKWKGVLSPAFTRAVREGKIPRNPWSGLAVPGRRRGGESPFWSDDEVARIEAQLDGWSRDLFVVGIHCGFRIEALLNLRWSDVRWEDPKCKGGSLTCRAEFSKNGRAYRVPLFPRLRETLERRHREQGRPPADALIFPGRRGQPMLRKTPDRHIEAAMKRAGVPDEGRRCHAMRETFGTRCGAKGVNPRILMGWLGHSSLKQTLKYIHVDAEAEAMEASKLG